MASETPERAKGGGALKEVAEDATGLGAAELRLTRDLIIRPRAAMDAYDAHGSTAGGLYPKPLRYWLTLNGLIVLVMAVSGGMERSLTAGSSSADEMLAELARTAGKTLEEFKGDLEQWMSMVMLPTYALTIGGALFLLIRRWSPADDRQDFHQTFTFLNAWTLWTTPVGLGCILWLSQGAMMWASFALIFLSVPIVYTVFGRGRWWRTARGAWLKGLVLLVVATLAFVPYSLIAGLLAYAGAVFLP